MPKDKSHIVKKIESFISNPKYDKTVENELYKNLKLFYMADKESFCAYVTMLFDTDFEKSVYAKTFIKFLGSASAESTLLLLESLFYKVEKTEIKQSIIDACSSTNNYKIKHFLYSLVEKDIFPTEAKLAIFQLGDTTYYQELLNEYSEKLKIGVFLPKHLMAFSNSGSRKIWSITLEYIKSKKIEQKTRYRILNYLLKLNDKNSSEILMELYQYYNSHTNITPSEARDISFNIYLKTEKYSESSTKFTDKIKKSICNKLKEYSYKEEVKNFLNGLNRLT